MDGSGTQANEREHFRLIDAPLTRISIGIARLFAGSPGLVSNWNWSEDWETNIQAGAYPDPDVLLVARLACAWLIPLAMVSFFFTARKFTNNWLALAISLLLAFNPLVLLHTRRAMAEGIQFSLTVFLLWVVFSDIKTSKLTLAAILSGLLLQAKQTAIPVIACAVIILTIRTWKQFHIKKALLFCTGAAVAVVVFFVLLNPVLLRDPIRTAEQMVEQRLAFSAEQTRQYAEINSGLALTSPGLRAAGLVAQGYLAPPAYFDTGNYQTELETSIQTYETNRIHTIFSGWIWGTILLILSLLGIVISIRNALLQKDIRYFAFTFVTAAVILFFILFISIGFQRYYVQLIPILLLNAILPIQTLLDLKRKQNRLINNI